MKKEIEWLLFESGITNYRISKETGIGQSALNKYTNGSSEIGNMSLDNALKLYNYYKREMDGMEKTMWEFEGYTVYAETDVLRFEDDEGNVLGYVMNEGNELVEELNNGADPIADGWEDGVGNTINIDGWGER